MEAGGPAKSMAWLLPLLQRVPAALTHMPSIVLCQLHAAGQPTTEFSAGSTSTSQALKYECIFHPFFFLFDQIKNIVYSRGVFFCWQRIDGVDWPVDGYFDHH